MSPVISTALHDRRTAKHDQSCCRSNKDSAPARALCVPRFDLAPSARPSAGLRPRARPASPTSMCATPVIYSNVGSACLPRCRVPTSSPPAPRPGARAGRASARRPRTARRAARSRRPRRSSATPATRSCPPRGAPKPAPSARAPPAASPCGPKTSELRALHLSAGAARATCTTPLTGGPCSMPPRLQSRACASGLDAERGAAGLAALAAASELDGHCATDGEAWSQTLRGSLRRGRAKVAAGQCPGRTEAERRHAHRL